MSPDDAFTLFIRHWQLIKAENNAVLLYAGTY